MKIVISYDVEQTDSAGRRRLRRVARACLDYGQRVQNSVFECEVGWEHYLVLRARLRQEMDETRDSIRIYHLGENPKKIEHFGIKSIPNMEADTLLF